MAWNLKYDGAVPPMPGPITPRFGDGSPGDAKRLFDKYLGAEGVSSPTREPSLKPGCWVVRIDPEYSDDVQRRYPHELCYEGTFRLGPDGEIQSNPSDLRLRGSGDLYLCREPKPFVVGESVPVFARDDYRFYFRLQRLWADELKIEFRLDVYRFDQRSETWKDDGLLDARLDWNPAWRYFDGVLSNEHGTPIADY